MRRMSAGAGYKYLLKTVVAGDGDRSLSTPLTRYYAETGTPPGRWMGSGVKDLGLQEGTEVTESQLALLIGHGRHPVTGDKLGRAYPVDNKDPDDPTKKPRKAVAGFDYTFSMPKSASVLWAVADAGTQAIIADAHHAAVRDVVDFVERELAATRMGTGTPDGAVAQVETRGLIAAAYDHWDSRAGDPHLHTHVVISNKVLTARDHKWRSLDSHAMYAWGVSASELHQAVLADHLTRALGVEWEPRSRGAPELASVPAAFTRTDGTSVFRPKALDRLLIRAAPRGRRSTPRTRRRQVGPDRQDRVRRRHHRPTSQRPTPHLGTGTGAGHHRYRRPSARRTRRPSRRRQDHRHAHLEERVDHTARSTQRRRPRPECRRGPNLGRGPGHRL